MKLPLSWLTEFVDLDMDLGELVDVMSMHGLEVEGVTRPGAGTAGVRTARVLHHVPHPDADTLRVVRVTGEDGTGEIEVVCGASNFDTGDVVLHAPPGATIPGLRLEAREIRGVVSNGMLCSPRELQVGEDHAGLLVLGRDVVVGQDLAQLVPVGEPVIEIAVQADRGDHLGVLGVARDLAAILDVPWRPPVVPEPPGPGAVSVRLGTDRCERFVIWELDGVDVGPSPVWMRQRLAQCGVRSIDVVVDVTNYVMLELGQPLHAFDLDELRGAALNVRASGGGERLVTLDDVDRALEPGDLVIEDSDRIVSLAGVMGGRDTEVTSSTVRILVEAAVWDPVAVRATSRRLGLVSEASTRFERRVDPEGADRAAARASALLTELAGAHVTGAGTERADPAPPWAAPAVVELDPARTRELLGIPDLDGGTQRGLLERSGCRVEGGVDGGGLEVVAPSWRGDLRRPADLAEEIARLHGYDRVPARLPAVPLTGGLTAPQLLLRELRTVALGFGFDEAVLRPFVGRGALTALVPTAGLLELANPLAQDAHAMRPSLVEGLLTALRHNVGQGRPGTALVEIGRIFRTADDELADVLDAVGGPWRWRGPDGDELPVQPLTVGLAAQGRPLGDRWLDPAGTWSVYDLLAVLDEMVRRAGITERLRRDPVDRERFHPGRSARLLLDGHEIGFAGALHPQEAALRDLPEPVVVAELLLDPLFAGPVGTGGSPTRARPLVRHPAMTVDVALVASDDIAYAALEDAVRDGAGRLLDALWWFDEYRGEQLGEGRRSVGIRLRLQDPEEQLTDADAEEVIAAIEVAATRIGATLRR